MFGTFLRLKNLSSTGSMQLRDGQTPNDYMDIGERIQTVTRPSTSNGD